MEKNLFLLSSLCVLLCACENSVTNTDNTARNARDRGATVTPTEQSENELDRSITQKIRQSLVDERNFSTNAKNIKIITINGVVTLRGVVNDEQEKNEIGRRARAISGVRNVDNQLEILRNEQPVKH